MSSTRRALSGGPLRQERYASSGEYSRGLLGNLVAKRTARLTSKTARERIALDHLGYEAARQLVRTYITEALLGELLQKGSQGRVERFGD